MNSFGPIKTWNETWLVVPTPQKKTGHWESSSQIWLQMNKHQPFFLPVGFSGVPWLIMGSVKSRDKLPRPNGWPESPNVIITSCPMSVFDPHLCWWICHQNQQILWGQLRRSILWRDATLLARQCSVSLIKSWIDSPKSYQPMTYHDYQIWLG